MRKMHFCAYCSIAKLSIMVGNLGWRLTLEKKGSDTPVCFHHQSLFKSSDGSWAFHMLAGGIILLCEDSTEFIKTLLGFLHLARNAFHIFFLNIQFWGGQNMLEKYVIHTRNSAVLNFSEWLWSLDGSPCPFQSYL